MTDKRSVAAISSNLCIDGRNLLVKPVMTFATSSFRFLYSGVFIFSC